VLVPVALDGLIPPIFCKIDPVTRIPVAGAWLVTIPIGLLAFMLDLEQITKIISMGNLLMYSFVTGCGIALRFRKQTAPTVRTPEENWVWLFLVVAFFAAEATMKEWHPVIVYSLWAVTAYILFRLQQLPQPNKPGEDEYTMPFVPLLPCLGIIGNYSLMGGFDLVTWIYYFCYILIGLGVYFWYGISHSLLETGSSDIGTISKVKLTEDVQMEEYRGVNE